MSKFSPELQLSKGTIIEFGVPSWHINAHGPDCQADFGLGFRDGVGRTCGEEVESTWARTNPLGLLRTDPRGHFGIQPDTAGDDSGRLSGRCGFCGRGNGKDLASACKKLRPSPHLVS
ncbi:hypothetical protein L208DRAFT_1533436 [Tricholoma matsutake]|nr:hypothetical protein L208DRAFT_1533436 [Tricholoma matsutake 945]